MSSRNDQPDRRPAPAGAERRLEIGSYDELIRNEPEILRRIKAMPNGGALFLINPFLLFEDIGVVLSDTAKREVLTAEPRLAGLSAIPYRALKTSRSRQNYRVNVRGLFERRSL
ncbi:MAG TPA: hypothetical protein VF543_19420 [Pyrinomonadaceae bacterium]